jgi:uncharacterized damage-inducible protein DinB
MAISESLLPEFDNEVKATRRLLERVPDSGGAWKPHDKSMSMGKLAIHIANLVGWVGMVVHDTQLDLSPANGNAPVQPQFESTARTLETFDANVIAARAALAGATDAAMLVPWSLKAGAHTIMTMPRIAVLRSMVMNHVIHHRGQLSVYLRLNDVAVPGVYGPSADES